MRVSLFVVLIHLQCVECLSLWSRPEALALVNHPLAVSIGTGGLPRGSLERCLLARAAVLEGIEAAANAELNAAIEDAARFDKANTFLTLARAELEATKDDHPAWRAAADDAGLTIELPPSEVDAGVRCYNCGGTHYNVDVCVPLRTAPVPSVCSTYVFCIACSVLKSFASLLMLWPLPATCEARRRWLEPPPCCATSHSLRRLLRGLGWRVVMRTG